MSESVEQLAATPTRCIVCATVVPEERTRFKSTTCTEEHAKDRKKRLQRGDRSCLCVVCGDPVPVERQRYGAITCKQEHKVLRKASIRARVKMRQCDFCHKPSTPAERAAFRRFRSVELTRPDLLYPRAWREWESKGVDLSTFASMIADPPPDFDLYLVDKRQKAAPGGANSGRPRLKWKGGDPECQHEPRVQRRGRKPLNANLRNTCRKGCGATRDDGEASNE